MLVSLQILQKGKVYAPRAPSPVYPEPSTTNPPSSARRQPRGSVRDRSNGISFWGGKKRPDQLLALRVAVHEPALPYLQLLVQAVELSYSWLVVVVTINPAVLQHLQLPGEFLYLWHRQHQLALLLLEQAVHLFNLLHWRGRESTIAALRNSRAWAASKRRLRGQRAPCRPPEQCCTQAAAGCPELTVPVKPALPPSICKSKHTSKIM